MNTQDEAGRRVVEDAQANIENAIEATQGAGAAQQAGANDAPLTANGDVPAALRGLPMRELIGAPLFAAAEAQERPAMTAWEYYKRIAYADDGKTTRTLDFELERPVEQNGEVHTVKQQVHAPFIGLVTAPSLLVDRVDVDFQMEVTDTNASKESTQAEVASSVSAKWWGVSASVSGKVTTARENTRQTNQTAKYQVHVTASQQPQTEGLSKLMDIMAACIEPIPTKE